MSGLDHYGRHFISPSEACHDKRGPTYLDVLAMVIFSGEVVEKDRGGNNQGKVCIELVYTNENPCSIFSL